MFFRRKRRELKNKIHDLQADLSTAMKEKAHYKKKSDELVDKLYEQRSKHNKLENDFRKLSNDYAISQVTPRHGEEGRCIHEFFELSYSSYLVIPRSILQSAPEEWQQEFVGLLDELDKATESLPIQPPAKYRVSAVNSKGRFTHDYYRNYDRGRRRFKLIFG